MSVAAQNELEEQSMHDIKVVEASRTDDGNVIINLSFKFKEKEMKNGKFECLAYLDKKKPYLIKITRPTKIKFVGE